MKEQRMHSAIFRCKLFGSFDGLIEEVIADPVPGIFRKRNFAIVKFFDGLFDFKGRRNDVIFFKSIVNQNFDWLITFLVWAPAEVHPICCVYFEPNL